MATIVDVYNYDKPYDYEFIPVKDLVGIPMEITHTKSFINKEGEEGWYFSFIINGTNYYSATHRKALCDALSRESTHAILANDTITTTIVEKISKQNRSYYAFA